MLLSPLIIVLRQSHCRLEAATASRTTSRNQSHVIAQPVAGGCAVGPWHSQVVACYCATSHSMVVRLVVSQAASRSQKSLYLWNCEVAIAGNSLQQLPTGPGRAIIMVAACRRFYVRSTRADESIFPGITSITATRTLETRHMGPSVAPPAYKNGDLRAPHIWYPTTLVGNNDQHSYI